MPALISPDGRWWWDGRQWRSRSVDGPLDLFWFTGTPDWFTRVAVTGLIGLIPIVGTINMLGWTLAATDMVRGGWKELPPAGFQHLERGVAPFLVGFLYGIALLVVVGFLLGLTILLAFSGRPQLVLALVLALGMLLLVIAWWLASLYLFAAIMLGSDRLGIGKALDPRRLFTLARANHDVSLHVALVYAGASIAVGVLISAVSFVFPLVILLPSFLLPAIYAMLVPSLSRFHVESPGSRLQPA